MARKPKAALPAGLAAKQIKALETACYGFSLNDSPLSGDSLLMGLELLVRAIGRQIQKAEAPAGEMAKVLDGVSAVLQFAAASGEYRSAGADGPLGDDERDALAACAAIAETAATLVRQPAIGAAALAGTGRQTRSGRGGRLTVRAALVKAQGKAAAVPRERSAS